MLRIALIQNDIIWDNVAQNHVILGDSLCKAANFGAQLVLLPEMFNTGFSCPQGEQAQEANLLGREFMAKESQRYGITIIGSLPDLRDDSERPFNTLYVSTPSGELASYSKIHLFSFGGEAEKYQAGVQTVTVQVNDFRMSLFICYDLRFADVFYGLAPQTDVFLISANWPAARQLHWETLLRARAIENLAYVVGVNRVGQGGGLDYKGGSQIISPLGDILVHAQDIESVVYADIDLDVVKEVRAKYPFLDDRKEL